MNRKNAPIPEEPVVSSMSSILVKDFALLFQKEEPLSILDVRTKDELKQGVLEHAVHIPFANLLVKLRNEQELLPFPKDQIVYIVCYDGFRSKLAAQLLKKQTQGQKGFVYLQDGVKSLIEYQKKIQDNMVKSISFFDSQELEVTPAAPVLEPPTAMRAEERKSERAKVRN